MLIKCDFLSIISPNIDICFLLFYNNNIKSIKSKGVFQKMKKSVKSANLHDINDLRYEDVLLPEKNGDEVLIEVKRCGICGSDLPRVYQKGTYHFPTVIGHEFSGKVVYDETGELTGKKVAVFPLLPCFECENCKTENYATCKNYDYYGSRRNGGMSEYIWIKRWNIAEMDDNLSYDEGAMCEPVSVAHHAIRKLDVQKGETVFISGAGPIGLIAGMWAKLFGAENVYYIDIDKRKIRFAEQLGFEEYTDNITADCVLEGTGHQSGIKKCLEVVKSQGKCVFMGNPSGDIFLERDTYWQILRKELKIFGTWNSSYSETSNDWKESLKAMAEKKIDVLPLITQKFLLSDCNKAFEIIKNKEEFCIKVMLIMNEEDV